MELPLTTIPCPDCEGWAKRICPACNGLGGEHYICDQCRGTGVLDCETCDGTGDVTPEEDD